jgi:hypothetical protein
MSNRQAEFDLTKYTDFFIEGSDLLAQLPPGDE